MTSLGRFGTRGGTRSRHRRWIMVLLCSTYPNFLFVSVHVYGIDPPKHVLLSGLGFHVIDRMEFLMWNRNVEIDRTHIRAICNEIGERLRISVSGEIPELSLPMRRQLDQLRELDEDASPSIVPAKGQF